LLVLLEVSPLPCARIFQKVRLFRYNNKKRAVFRVFSRGFTARRAPDRFQVVRSSVFWRRRVYFNERIDTTYIDDAARDHWLAAEKLSPGAPCAGKVYFISQGDPRPNWDIINMILAAAGAGAAVKRVPYAPAYAAAAAMEVFWRLAGLKTEPPLPAS